MQGDLHNVANIQISTARFLRDFHYGPDVAEDQCAILFSSGQHNGEK